MKNTTRLAVLTAAFALAVTSSAAAQGQKRGFVDVNGGAQPQTQTLSSSSSFGLYGETAVINSAQGVDGSGLFDISGGYRVANHISAAVGFSIASRSGAGTIAASVPSPTVFNKPNQVTASG